MSDQALPLDAIDFEDIPPIARPSEHLPLLLALKGAPGRSARIQKDIALGETDANRLATAVKGAAAKIGNGYSVKTRYIPALDHYGVWVTYSPAEGDEPPVPTPEQRAEAKAIIDEAMTPAYRRGAIPANSAPVTADEDIDPIGDDNEWELPERSGVPM